MNQSKTVICLTENGSWNICRTDLQSIGNIHFEQMVDRMYLAVIQLDKANSFDAEAPFLSEYIHI